ncbi:NAD-dependent epimerase/dehydratase family protein [Nocardia terrae]|uniref:NAD-dependent epimerase/dehydratase family protein n=1 Tax=Nocardia terrae TaxID=2675851 RepID=UPI0012FC2776|nr:NAD-dependent epimerase/dehydratase family protein [Nocardia terrae]
MRVLVTGAAGYLGKAVVAALAAAGHEPIAMARPGAGTIPGAADTRTADLLDPAALRRAVAGVESVCHLAGLTRARESLTDPLPYFHVNTGGTIALLRAMAEADVRALVFSSTCAVYGSPEQQPMTEETPIAPPHPYASSKVAAEAVVEAQAATGSLGATILRLPNLAGGDDRDPTRLIPRVLAAAMARTPLGINGDGTAVRDYLHVDDAAAAFVAAIDRTPEPGGFAHYNIGSGRGTTILDVVAAVERETGLRVPVVHKPPAPEPSALIVDPSRAMTDLSWSPKHSDITEILQTTRFFRVADLRGR